MGLEPASVSASVCASNLSNMNISATGRPIAIKFYLKHHWGGGKGCIRFWARSDQTMAADICSSHSVIMGENGVATFFSVVFIRSFFILTGNDDII